MVDALPSPLREVASGVHVAEAPQRFLGLEVGARMTALQVDGGVLVHSPIALAPEVVAPLGPLRAVVAPNLLHHLHVGPWAARAAAWAAPGLAQKRPDVPFAGVLGERPDPFGADVRVKALSCIPMTNEAVLLHRPSRTLVVSDLVFNFPRQAPWLTRAAMRCLCGYPGCRVSLVERFAMRRHRAKAREELAEVLRWDFDRLVMAHGAVIESGGKAALQQAYAWLGA